MNCSKQLQLDVIPLFKTKGHGCANSYLIKIETWCSKEEKDECSKIGCNLIFWAEVPMPWCQGGP